MKNHDKITSFEQKFNKRKNMLLSFERLYMKDLLFMLYDITAVSKKFSSEFLKIYCIFRAFGVQYQWGGIVMCTTTEKKEPNRQLGSVLMATSSIFTRVKITHPKKVEMFVEALEASEKAQINKPSAPSIPVLKDLDEIRKLAAKRKTAK